MTILLTLLRFAWPYLLGAAVAGGAYLWAYNRGVAHEHVKVVAAQAEFSAYRNQAEAQAHAAKAAADALQTRWNSERLAAGSALAQANKARKAAFDQLAARAVADVPAGSAGLGSAARVVMRDASAAANSRTEAASAAAASGGDPQPAEAVSQRAVAQAWIAAADAYRDAREHWAACVAFYDGLVAQQGEAR